MKNKKHKFMRVASLALAASLSFSTMTAFADWKQEGNTWKYQNSDGKYVNHFTRCHQLLVNYRIGKVYATLS